MSNPHNAKSELKVSAQRANKSRIMVNLRGPGAVIIMLVWLAAVTCVVIYADSIGRAIGVSLLAFFIAAYFRELQRNPL